MNRSVPVRSLFAGIVWAVALCALPTPARAHDRPYSYLELRAAPGGIEAKLEAPAVDFAHELGDPTPDTLLKPAALDKYRERLLALVRERLTLESGGEPLRAELRGIEPLPEPRDVRLRLFYPSASAPDSLRLRCRLFPYDPRHKTFLTLYDGERLAQETVFTQNTDTVTAQLTKPQSAWEVARQFVAEGIHHIFIGPDHILFVVGLMLLPATLFQVLKIVTAFTVAHSITLTLATLSILNLPSRLVESTIALSIVFVGVHALAKVGERRRDQSESAPPRHPTPNTQHPKPDARLLFAFAFGLIHGFGFASVLGDLELPRAALGVSLAAFNVGVEIGQACIVLAVVPVLALTRRRSPLAARGVVTAGALVVIAAGGYWFIERVFLQG